MVDLAELTTLRVGGPAKEFVVADSEEALIGAVTEADDAQIPVLLIGGGSNLLVTDSGFDGRVIEIASRGIHAENESDTMMLATVQAGEPWDEFVAITVGNNWSGLEMLSGVPGLVGATPIQNVGAYGGEVGRYIVEVRAWDRQQRRIQSLDPIDCAFSYRDSVFKRDLDRWVVLSVTFRLPITANSAPIRYYELAQALGVSTGFGTFARDVRDTVLKLRASKGMLLDPADHDTWSAGSFFTNPILDLGTAASLAEAAPRYPQADGSVKTSAAWLIENSGFYRGYGTARATISTKHALAVTNRGGARAADLLALAREVRDGVRAKTGINLRNEPIIVGDAL